MKRLDPSGKNADLLGRELDALLAAYRDACPDPEPSANFMPELWARIDNSRSASYNFRRWTQALVTAAAAICLILGFLQARLPSQPTFYTQSYIEALQQENATEVPPSLEAVVAEVGGSHQ